VIIALGEALIVAAAGLAGAATTPAAITTGVLAVGAVPWVAMAVLLAMLVAVSVIEHRRPA